MQTVEMFLSEVQRLAYGKYYEPKTVEAMAEALDDAWADVGFMFDGAPDRAQTARRGLAKTILAAAWRGTRDVEGLKLAGVEWVKSMHSSPLHGTKFARRN